MTTYAHENLWNVARTVLRGNFIALSVLSLRKKITINDLDIQLKHQKKSKTINLKKDLKMKGESSDF